MSFDFQTATPVTSGITSSNYFLGSLSQATTDPSIISVGAAVGSSTVTFTNKTFNTAGTGNTFQINSTTISGIVGSGSSVLTTSTPISTSLSFLNIPLAVPTDVGTDGTGPYQMTFGAGTFSNGPPGHVTYVDCVACSGWNFADNATRSNTSLPAVGQVLESRYYQNGGFQTEWQFRVVDTAGVTYRTFELDSALDGSFAYGTFQITTFDFRTTDPGNSAGTSAILIRPRGPADGVLYQNGLAKMTMPSDSVSGARGLVIQYPTGTSKTWTPLYLTGNTDFNVTAQIINTGSGTAQLEIFANGGASNIVFVDSGDGHAWVAGRNATDNFAVAASTSLGTSTALTIDRSTLVSAFTAAVWSGAISSALTTLTGASDGMRVSVANATTYAAENTTTSSATSGGLVGMYCNDGAAMASGDRLGGIRMGGSSSASALRNSAGVFAFASQAWVDASAYGSRLEFQNTTNGATALGTKAILSNAGIFALGATLANTVPALKPSSTTLVARLADDSADCDFTAANITASATLRVNATPTAVGTGSKTISNASDSSTNFGHYAAINMNGTVYYFPCSSVAPT